MTRTIFRGGDVVLPDRLADRHALIVEAGRVVEVGSHDVLLARGGRYARLHATQFAT